MQSRRPDQSFTAPAAGTSLSADPVDVVVLTTDVALLETLQEAVSPEHALWHAQSADATVELLVGGHCGVLIADLQVLRMDAARMLERLQAQFPELVLLATGRREEEHTVAALVGSGRVYRFLHKPVSPARASLFLSAATRKYLENSGSVSPALAAVRQLTRPSNRTATIMAAAAGIAVLLLAWMYWPRGHQSPTGAAVATATKSDARKPPVADASASANFVPEQLTAAQRALAAGRLTAPSEDNALDHYRKVLTKEPNNREAAAGVAQIASTLEAQVIAALTAKDLPKAAVALTALQRAQPDSPKLDSLRKELLTLSRSSRPEPAPAAVNEQPPKAATPRAVAPTPSAPPVTAAKSPANLATARARIASGQLTEPAEDSAVYFLRRAVAAGENESASSIVATDLGTRMLDQARQAVAAGNAEDAQRALAAVTQVDREFDLGLPDLDAVRQQVNSMLTSNRRAAIAEQLAQATKSREAGRLLTPAGNNAYEQLSAIIAKDPDLPEVRTEQQRLAFTLLESTRTAMAAGDIGNAEVLARRADSLVPDMANTRTLLQQIAATRQERALANTPMQAATLKRTREVAYVYPRDAERASVEGWVDVEFTIAPDGTTTNLQVRSAEPKDIFDKAALDALSKWRFEPVQRNGAPVAQRATIRVRFALK